MRQISVSIDVFAEIWRRRLGSEDSEDAILHRLLLGTAPSIGTGTLAIQSPRPPVRAERPQGVLDRRFKVHFPEETVIFRRFKGNLYRAVAREGYWILEGDGNKYTTLNELSKAIGAGTENAWTNWHYSDATGEIRRVSDLRSPELIKSRVSYDLNYREKVQISPADALEENESGPNGGSDKVSLTWRECVRLALDSLGGVGHLSKIYDEVESFRRQNGLSIPPSLDAVVRRTLEENSSDSDVHKGEHDLFKMYEGKGAGVWGLR